MEKLLHATMEGSQKTTKGVEELRLVTREEAPEYLRKPWVHTGYLVGEPLCLSLSLILIVYGDSPPFFSR